MSQSEAPGSINPRRLIIVKDNSENQFHRDGSWESLMSEFQEENFNRLGASTNHMSEPQSGLSA